MKQIFTINANNIRSNCLAAGNLFESWGVHPEDARDMVLAIDEALTNIYEHGIIPEWKEKICNVILEIFRVRDKIYILIADYGNHFSFDSIIPPDKKTYIKSDIIGGFGISIIRRVMDSVRHFQLFDENVMILEKDVRYVKNEETRYVTSKADAFIENGILTLIFKPESVITMDDARQHVSLFHELVINRRNIRIYGVVFDTANIKKISPEARQYYLSRSSTGVNGVAIVCYSKITRLICSLLLFFQRRKWQPIKLVDSQSEAVRWLRAFADNSSVEKMANYSIF